jgi:hypothetical protein
VLADSQGRTANCRTPDWTRSHHACYQLRLLSTKNERKAKVKIEKNEKQTEDDGLSFLPSFHFCHPVIPSIPSFLCSVLPYLLSFSSFLSV